MDAPKFLSPKHFLSARGMTKIFMVVALIGFAMPFLFVSCGSNNITVFSGYDLTFGKEVFIIDSLIKYPIQPLVFIGLLACVCTLICAALPKQRYSLLVWGISTIIGLASMIIYLVYAAADMITLANRSAGFDLSSILGAGIGSGLVLAIMMLFGSFVMFLRKLFFEEPDPIPLKVDESDIYTAIMREEKQQKAEEKAKQEEVKQEPKEKSRVEDKQSATFEKRVETSEKVNMGDSEKLSISETSADVGEEVTKETAKSPIKSTEITDAEETTKDIEETEE